MVKVAHYAQQNCRRYTICTVQNNHIQRENTHTREQNFAGLQGLLQGGEHLLRIACIAKTLDYLYSALKALEMTLAEEGRFSLLTSLLFPSPLLLVVVLLLLPPLLLLGLELVVVVVALLVWTLAPAVLPPCLWPWPPPL